MRASEIRRQFLRFFEERGHRVVPSSPVVPQGDPTLLFTNAGMNQFKDVFLGRERRDYTRACSSQKCIRAGGKHNDLEEVGRTPRHQTFFEMLGNFSFGDYFKEDAIRYAWEFITQVVRLPKDRLWVTIFREDDEAYALWRKVTDVPAERIVRLGEKDNFWQMGDTGPCGPCTEIHYDRRDDPAARAVYQEDALLEFWNLVFMQFDRQASGELVPLPKPSVDTGMGLERLACLLQGKTSNYETDLLRPIIDEVAALAGVAYDPGPDGVPHRVIADHIRTLVFAFTDGALPANDGRGYVLRRILRRAARYVRKLGVETAILHRLVPCVIGVMGEAFPDLAPRADHVTRVIRDEEERFNKTLDRGLALFEESARPLAQGAAFPGSVAWKLYDTYGFPSDLTRILCEERGLRFDEAGFEKGRLKAVELAQAAQKFTARDLGGHGEVSPTVFVGYDKVAINATVLSYLHDKGELVLDKTPFYAESGGQVGDQGRIRALDGSFTLTVLDTQKQGGIWIHSTQLVSGDPSAVRARVEVEAAVDAERRSAILRNHTATHLLHWALHETVGDHATQAGSVVAPDRLRFDFTHPQALKEDELEAIERLVNLKVGLNDRVEAYQRSLEEARAAGAMALFGEKYGERVRVIDIGGYSKELCGGTHVRRTGEIGLFKVVQESAVQAGVRRITALTGTKAIDWALDAHKTLRALARKLAAPEAEIAERLDKLQADVRAWKKKAEEAERAARKAGGAGGPGGVAGAGGPELDEERNGLRLTVTRLDAPVPELKKAADAVKGGQGAVVGVYADRGEAVNVVIACSKEAVARGVKAGDLIKAIAAEVGGGGGGRPDMAQAGGVPGARFEDALAIVRAALDGAGAPASAAGR